jgi:hypothetical protein
VEANFLERLQQFVNENGHHMPDLIFRSWLLWNAMFLQMLFYQ